MLQLYPWYACERPDTAKFLKELSSPDKLLLSNSVATDFRDIHFKVSRRKTQANY